MSPPEPPPLGVAPPPYALPLVLPSPLTPPPLVTGKTPMPFSFGKSGGMNYKTSEQHAMVMPKNNCKLGSNPKKETLNKAVSNIAELVA